jgi:hypothetical protein
MQLLHGRWILAQTMVQVLNIFAISTLSLLQSCQLNKKMALRIDIKRFRTRGNDFRGSFFYFRISFLPKSISFFYFPFTQKHFCYPVFLFRTRGNDFRGSFFYFRTSFLPKSKSFFLFPPFLLIQQEPLFYCSFTIKCNNYVKI